MLFKEAISTRIIQLCKNKGFTINRLAELSAIPPTTLRSLISNQVENPSALLIYRVCGTLKITMKDFFDDELFNPNNLDD